MSRSSLWTLRVAFLLMAILIFSERGRAELRPVVQVIGKLSVSVDAAGNNNPDGGTIRVQKPLGATVHSAYLMAASNFNRIIANGDITLAGKPVSWDRTVFNSAGPSSPEFFHNVFA